MGELARTLVSLSGPEAVNGIIPETLMKLERNYDNDSDSENTSHKAVDEKTFGRLTVVADMHARKQMMMREVIEGGSMNEVVKGRRMLRDGVDREKISGVNT
jgi:hypothetical protein